MRWFVTFLLAFGLFSIPLVLAAQEKIWLDESCTGLVNIPSNIQEALDMASSAANRLEQDSDTDFANVFKAVFKVDKSDTKEYKVHGRENTIYNIVHDIMSEIGNERTIVSARQERRTSDVRIYCDNGNHWGERGDDGKYTDNLNMMRTKEICDDDPDMYAGTYLKKDSRIGRENPNRSIIDICDLQLTGLTDPDEPALPGSISDIDSAVDLSQSERGIEFFSQLMSFTVLHELTHTRAFRTDDPAYGWEEIMELSAEESVKNADSYGVWAALADVKPTGENIPDGSGYTLPRLPADPSSKNQKTIEDEIKDGKIVLVPGLTKRSWLDTRFESGVTGGQGVIPGKFTRVHG